MMGNLRITPGINSRTTLPAASVAMETKKVLATSEALMLFSG
jgi:hypothetical protein